MMYPFMTLNGETEIVHSDMQDDGRVKCRIYFWTCLLCNIIQEYLHLHCAIL